MIFCKRTFIFVGLSLATLHGQAQSSLEGFSSGRYEIRKSGSATKSRVPASEAEGLVTDSVGAKNKSNSETLPTELPTKTMTKEAMPGASLAASQKEGVVVMVGASALATTDVVMEATAASDSKIVETEVQVQEPGIGVQAQSIFNDGASKIQEFYREQVHPDDIRNNRVEIELAPTVIYNDSASNYSFRDYQSYFNTLKIRANVWLTPLIGLSGQILFSFAADVDEVGSSSRVPAKYEFVDLGLNFRKFFGVSRKSNSSEFSILLSDNKMNVPSTSTTRGRLKSSGLGVGVKGRFPTSVSYAWTIGGTFFPRLQHSEAETGFVLNSGSIQESSRVGLDLGGEWKFDRESQMIWGLGISSERNIFSGTAGALDPSTGTTPNNVSVTNSLYLFSLGYRWGH